MANTLRGDRPQCRSWRYVAAALLALGSVLSEHAVAALRTSTERQSMLQLGQHNRMLLGSRQRTTSQNYPQHAFRASLALRGGEALSSSATAKVTTTKAEKPDKKDVIDKDADRVVTRKATTKKGKASKKKKKQLKAKDTPQTVGEITSSSNDNEPVVDSLKEKKQKISEVLNEDPSTVLGDAIRDRADQLLSSPSLPPSSPKSKNPLLDQIDQTVSSVGWALGAADRLSTLMQNATQKQQRDSDEEGLMKDDDTGGVEAATTSVLVHYFLKSHGGAHAVQCLCSLLAATTGLSAVLLPLIQNKFAMDGASSSNSPAVSDICVVLIRRCLTFAMMKHVSGMLAASVVTAKAIPEVGLRNARLWIQDLVRDPVSQYVFYTACVLLWLPATAASSRPTWWQAFGTVPLLLVGPVVFRECINTLYVLSDVLILWLCSNQTDSSKGASSAVIRRILRLWQVGMDACMSILVTPKVWRSADAMKRQAILAKLTSRFSLALELLVGLLISTDALVLSAHTLYNKPTERPPWGSVLKTFLCAHLYLQFLWVRRRKISRLATQVRGGAAQLPLYILDVLMDPASAIGLDKVDEEQGKTDDDGKNTITWKDWLGIEEKSKRRKR